MSLLHLFPPFSFSSLILFLVSLVAFLFHLYIYPCNQHIFSIVSSMDSNATTLLLSSPLPPTSTHKDNVDVVFDPSYLQKQPHIPVEFIWPQGDRIHTLEELNEPLVDLGGFLHGDEAATREAAKLIRVACQTHGFFQVTNHGVDAALIRSARDHVDNFFKLPLSQKLRARRSPGSMWGYVGAHADRFSSKLPWKETLSFGFHDHSSHQVVLDYFTSVLGEEFQQTGCVGATFCINFLNACCTNMYPYSYIKMKRVEKRKMELEIGGQRALHITFFFFPSSTSLHSFTHM